MKRMGDMDAYNGQGRGDNSGKRKRGPGGSGQFGPGGGPLDHNNEIRMLIPSRFAGAIIGKGGENINRLRSEHDCSVHVPDSDAPERVLFISAEWNNAKEVLRDCIQKIERDKRPDDPNEARILVHQSHAGAIIGKGGFKVKEIREETKANIKVYSTCAPNSTDRVVLLEGENDVIVHAVQLIHDLLADIPAKGVNRPYDTLAYDPSFVGEYGGISGQMRGGGGGMMSMRGGPRNAHGHGGPPPTHRGPSYSGPPPQRGYAGGAGGGYGMDNYGAPPPAMAPPADNYSAYGPMNASMQTQQVTIPNELAGTIIGRGGERISNIRQDSGASILVEPPAPGSTERVITISGTPQAIQMAQFLLQQCVRASSAGRKYIEEQQMKVGGGPPPNRGPRPY